jgi:hypothetical protein
MMLLAWGDSLAAHIRRNLGLAVSSEAEEEDAADDKDVHPVVQSLGMILLKSMMILLLHHFHHHLQHQPNKRRRALVHLHLLKR